MTADAMPAGLSNPSFRHWPRPIPSRLPENYVFCADWFLRVASPDDRRHVTVLPLDTREEYGVRLRASQDCRWLRICQPLELASNGYLRVSLTATDAVAV